MIVTEDKILRQMSKEFTVTNEELKETVELMTKNHVGELVGPGRGFGLGFGLLYDTNKDLSPANTGQIYWGGYFKTHFFIDPKESLIAIIMTQKIPNTDEYIIELNRAVYGALSF